MLLVISRVDLAAKLSQQKLLNLAEMRKQAECAKRYFFKEMVTEDRVLFFNFLHAICTEVYSTLLFI